jgi:hypothetical protein
LTYTLAVSEFRKVCKKEFLDEITPEDLKTFEIAMVESGTLADRTIHNRLGFVSTFLRANNIMLNLKHKYVRKKIKSFSFSLDEVNALIDASPDKWRREPPFQF